MTVSVGRVSGGSDSESPGKHGIIIPPVPIKASRVSKLTKICLNMFVLPLLSEMHFEMGGKRIFIALLLSGTKTF